VIGRRTLRLVLAPVVILTTGACFATREDLRIVHTDLKAMQADRVAADSAILRLIEQVTVDLARVSAVVATISDSSNASSITLNRLRNDSREDLQAIRQQLIMIQELTGQSQRRIQELRAEMEERAAELATPVAPPPSTRPPGTAAAPAPPPGPAQLYQMGQDQLRRGSASAARTVFTQLITAHPTSDLAPQALYGIAESWADEGNGRNADSVYALVVERYPRSEQAPNALYKRANAARSIGQNEQAMVLYRQIVAEYPRSDAALLAQEFLRGRP